MKKNLLKATLSLQIALVALCGPTYAQTDSGAAAGTAESSSAPAASAPASSGQPVFNFAGKAFNYSNADDDGRLQLTPAPDGSYSKIHATGKIELVSESLTLRCNELDYSKEAGKMIALGKQSQAELIQGEAKAYADKVVFFEKSGNSELTGNAKIVQVSPTDITNVYGEDILQKENEDGSSLIFVRQQPRMENFPNPDAPAQTDANPTSGTETSEAEQSAQTVKMGLGDKITLTADAQKGEFELSLNPQGKLVEFVARNNVDLVSDRLNLKSDRLEMHEDGKKITATGAPVRINQGNVKANCHTFIYDTETKTSTLTGDPHVYRTEEGGNTTHASAREILLTEDETGKVYYTLIGAQNVTTEEPGKAPPAQMELKPQKKPAEQAASDQPQKIDSDNIDSIPQITPEFEQ